MGSCCVADFGAAKPAAEAVAYSQDRGPAASTLGGRMMRVVHLPAARRRKAEAGSASEGRCDGRRSRQLAA